MAVPVFQSLTKPLAKEIRSKTLELYKSLLKSSQQFEGKDVLKDQINISFKANKHTCSKQKLAKQIETGVKVQECLSKALNGDKEMLGYVQNFINKHKIMKKSPTSTKTDKKRLIKRKPYQVAIETKTAIGYTFKRVRGWVQPVSTSMMLKKRVIQQQKSLNRLQHLQHQLEWMKAEQRFLSELRVQDNLYDYIKNIRLAMDENYKNQKKRDAKK